MQVIGQPMIFRQLPLELALQKTKELGYDALELWAPQIAECRTNALRERLRSYCEDQLGLPLVRLNAADASYFFPFGNQGDYQKILPGLLQDVDVTSALGMPHLLTWEGRIPPSGSRQDRFGWILSDTVEMFKRATDYGHRLNVQISVEVHPYTLGIDTEWLLALFEKVDDDTFGLTYDCCHYGVGQPDTYIAAIDQLGTHIKHIHFCDSDKTSSELHFAPGTGCLDLEGVVATFKKIGFTGTTMLDLWLYPFPEQGSIAGLSYIRSHL
jgi:sugar phosphate isomerase/epimerase